MLKLKNVSKYYHSNDTVAMGLRKVTVDFELGEFVAVTGESGSGKSTLLNVISGLDTYEDGELYVNEEETSYYNVADWENYRRQYIGFVFQEYNIIDSYSVYENVMIALTIQGYDKDQRSDRAKELIDRVGLTSHIHHKASKLSGGQKQRAVIARALAKDCPIIVADEPTGNLDSTSSDTIIKLLKEISKDKLVIVVTHNYDEVADYATRKIRLFDGEIVEDKQIKSYDPVDDPQDIVDYKMTRLNSLWIATKNLLRTPKRTTFTLVVGLFIALIFMFSFGSFVQNTTQTTNYYGGGYFNNISENRIIVTKFDASMFSANEINEIHALKRVRDVVNHDVLLDMQVFSFNQHANQDWVETREFYVNPATALSISDLADGRLPNNYNEIVISESTEYMVGDTIDIAYRYMYETYNEDTGEVERQMPETDTFTIVGMTNQRSRRWQENLYFHNSFLQDDDIIKHAYVSNTFGKQYIELSIQATNTTADQESNTQLWGNYQVDDSLPDNTLLVHQEFINMFADQFGYDVEATPSWLDNIAFQLVTESSFEDNTIDITLQAGADVNKESNIIYLSDNLFDQIVPDDYYQISVIVDNGYDASIVMTALEDDGFNTIYPADVTDMYGQVIQLIQTIYFGFLMALLMLVIYFISYIVLRNVQNAKKKDYLVFRSIGASKKALNRVTIYELMITMVVAFIITLGFFIINQYINTFIPNYLGYFTWTTYVAIGFILLLLAWLLGNRFNKKIFSRSVITSLKQE
ncbi:MAG: ABC transporter ATP-binding protein/permease [Candidatus Izemoplasma sp.]|nr:ABC transporter ATP-binding protein/permease [Candidatus Izemoplasma sp.]